MPGGRGVFACRPIAAGTRLFGEDDWADEAERRSFSTLSPQQLSELKPRVARDLPALRLQHRSRPDHRHVPPGGACVIRSISSITAAIPMPAMTAWTTSSRCAASRAGEEIRMDYGTFSFSFDHEFDLPLRRPLVPRQGHRQRLAGPVAHRAAPAGVHAGARGPGALGVTGSCAALEPCHDRRDDRRPRCSGTAGWWRERSARPRSRFRHGAASRRRATPTCPAAAPPARSGSTSSSCWRSTSPTRWTSTS